MQLAVVFLYYNIMTKLDLNSDYIVVGVQSFELGYVKRNFKL